MRIYIRQQKNVCVYNHQAATKQKKTKSLNNNVNNLSASEDARAVALRVSFTICKKLNGCHFYENFKVFNFAFFFNYFGEKPSAALVCAQLIEVTRFLFIYKGRYIFLKL